MLTWLRIVVSCFCLVLCVLFTALWVLSYVRTVIYDTTEISPNLYRVNYYLIAQGTLSFKQRTSDGKDIGADVNARQSFPPDGHMLRRKWETIDHVPQIRPKSNFLGIGYRSLNSRSGIKVIEWSLPYWILVAIFGLTAFIAKPKPRWRFGLRELFVLSTIGAITVGTLAFVLRAISA